MIHGQGHGHGQEEMQGQDWKAKKQLDSMKSSFEAIFQSPSSDEATRKSGETRWTRRGPPAGAPSRSGETCWTRKGPPAAVFGGIDAAWVLILDGRTAHRWSHAHTGETAVLAFMDKADAERYARLLQAIVQDPYIPTLIAGPKLISVCEQDQQEGMLEMPGSLVKSPMMPLSF